MGNIITNLNQEKRVEYEILLLFISTVSKAPESLIYEMKMKVNYLCFRDIS